MAIDQKEFKKNLSEAFIELLDSKRGIPTKLANSIGKTPSFVSQVKQGKPVNALHLKAVGLVFGPDKVVELLSLNNSIEKNNPSEIQNNRFKNPTMGAININYLVGIEKISEDLYMRVSENLKTTYETAQILRNENRKKIS